LIHKSTGKRPDHEEKIIGIDGQHDVHHVNAVIFKPQPDPPLLLPLKHMEGFVHVVGHIDRFFDKFILQIFHIAHAVEMEMSELLFVPAQHMVLQFVGHVFARLAVKFVDQAVRIFGRDEMGKQTASISIRSSYGSKVRWG
jgi:hypothetical protein